MDHVGLQRYFDERPITDEEKSSGTLLRLAACFRSDEGLFSDGPTSFIWVVLVANIKCATHMPHVVALLGERRLIKGLIKVKPRLVAKHRLTGEAFCEIEEYSVCIPERYRRFIVFYGGRRLLIGPRIANDFKAEYAARIANASVDAGYPKWLDAQRSALSRLPVPKDGPLMSIVTPAYKTPPKYLREMMESVLAQTYLKWELVIVNASPTDVGMRQVLTAIRDDRIKIVDCPENHGITGNTNFGISYCTGDYVSFFDHDDVIEPNALAELVRAIVYEESRPGLLYCDEDNIDEHGNPSLPVMKPGYAEDFLLCNNYVCHWLTVRRDLLEQVELSRKDVEGAQDYDLTFKIAECGERVVRVPHVLYHWRIHSGSTAGDPASKSYAQDAGTRAIEAHLSRTGGDGRVSRGRAYFTYVTEFELPNNVNRLEVVSPGGLSKTTSEALVNLVNMDKVQVNHIDMGFSEKLPIDELDSGYALFCTANHDLGYGDLRKLLARVAQDGVFAAAPRVLRDDSLFDYAGMIVCPDGTFRHLCRLVPEQDGGYVGRTERPYNATILNHECVLVDVGLLKSLVLNGGFSTRCYALAEAFVQSFYAGLRNVYLPYATARLNSPRSVFDNESTKAGLRDVARLIELFPELASGDPSHNPNFDPWSGYYRLNWKQYFGT